MLGNIYLAMQNQLSVREPLLNNLREIGVIRGYKERVAHGFLGFKGLEHEQDFLK